MTPLEAAAGLLALPEVEVLATLGGSHRSEVWRVATPDGSAIVKSYLQPERGTWRREAAGLVAGRGVRCPELLGLHEDPPVVVMSDLGDGPSLADRLLAPDPGPARRSLQEWARAVGEFQAATVDGVAAFEAALGDLDARSTAAEVARLGAVLAGTAEEHDLPWSDAVPAALAEAAGELADPTAQRLSPGDTCPDNNVETAAGLRLIDFEFAEVRHAAWEAAYLRVPWPTCWCAWQLPLSEARAAEAALRRAVGGPAVRDGFDDAVEVAVVLWCLLSSSWFLAGALDETSVNTDTDRRPGRWTMILGRLALAERGRGPAALTSYAAQLRRELHARWGDHPLALAPAFA